MLPSLTPDSNKWYTIILNDGDRDIIEKALAEYHNKAISQMRPQNEVDRIKDILKEAVNWTPNEEQ